MSSPSRSPLPSPSLPAPSRSSQSSRSKCLSHASNLGRSSVSPLTVYMFRCCSLETSRPRLLPQSLKDCSINLCLFFCSAYRVKSPLDCKEIQPVNPKGNQSWIFIGRAEAETSILWPPDAKNRLIRKDPDAGKDWRQEEKGMIDNEMVGWHHQHNGHESE